MILQGISPETLSPSCYPKGPALETPNSLSSSSQTWCFPILFLGTLKVNGHRFLVIIVAI